MKIVHVLCSDRLGGLENAYANVTRALVALGHEVEAWAPEGADYVSEDVARWGFAPRGHYDLAALWRARRRLVSARPDLLITHNARATQALACARWRLRVPQLGFAHSYHVRRMRGADTVVVLTEHMRSHFAAGGCRSVTVFPNMLWELPPEVLPPRAESKPVTLGFMGRLAPEKGLRVLLEAIRSLGQGHALRIAGAGPDEDAARSQAAGLDVRFDGWVEDVRAWLAGIDLLVVPSLSETFGVVVLEAMAHGRPIVTTDASGPASQVVHDATGWIARAGDSDDLAGQIRAALSTRGRWPEIVAAAHCTARRYDAQNLVPALGRIVEEAVQKP